VEYVEPIRSAEKIRQMQECLRRRGQRDLMLFLVGIYTGLRISDVRLLRARDVRGQTHLVVRTTKTGKRIQILIAPRLASAVKSYCTDLEDGDYLFPSRVGTNRPLTRSRCYQILREAAEACGIPRIGTHSMRKTFGYHFYRRTKDVAALQGLLGHKNPSVTLRYIGILQDDLDTQMRGFQIGD
jgi:integrase